MPTFLFLSHGLKREKHVPKLNFLDKKVFSATRGEGGGIPQSRAEEGLEAAPEM